MRSTRSAASKVASLAPANSQSTQPVRVVQPAGDVAVAAGEDDQGRFGEHGGVACVMPAVQEALKVAGEEFGRGLVGEAAVPDLGDAVDVMGCGAEPTRLNAASGLVGGTVETRFQVSVSPPRSAFKAGAGRQGRRMPGSVVIPATGAVGMGHATGCVVAAPAVQGRAPEVAPAATDRRMRPQDRSAPCRSRSRWRSEARRELDFGGSGPRRRPRRRSLLNSVDRPVKGGR
jgi:hypothetical protein